MFPSSETVQDLSQIPQLHFSAYFKNVAQLWSLLNTDSDESQSFVIHNHTLQNTELFEITGSL